MMDKVIVKGRRILEDMANLSERFSQPSNFITRLDEIYACIHKNYPKANIQIKGTLRFPDKDWGFDNRKELVEILAEANIDEMVEFHYWIEGKKGDSFDNFIKIYAFCDDFSDSVKIELSRGDPRSIKNFSKDFLVACGSKVLKYDPAAEVARANSEELNKCADILLKLPDYQTRISRMLNSEKDVQEFVYPILKSHFPNMVEEDYLPQVAGAASKPDFGMPDYAFAVECKFLDKQKYKKLGEEIAVDLLRYFGSLSPYNKLIVLIYDVSHQPIPANFISDLEQREEIAKVIVTPNVVPKVAS